MGDSQVVQVVQTSSYSRQLFTKKDQAVDWSWEHGSSNYQDQPRRVGFLPEVLPEIKVGQPLVDEAERVCLG